MQAIAISSTLSLIYEGDGAFGYGLWPAPVLTVATILPHPGEEALIPVANDLTSVQTLFREDSFDPITKIRRGRLYKSPGTQPQSWRMQPHPAFTEEVGHARNHAGWLTKSVYGFLAMRLPPEIKRCQSAAIVALGTSDAYTLWRIVDIERIATGEDLLVLRARGSLGVLPELLEDAIPPEGRQKVIEAYAKLSDAAYRAGPESIIDRARDIAQWSLGVWLAVRRNEPRWRTMDLGALAKNLPDDHDLLKSIANALARMHARGKPNEQERYNTRPLIEGDAEFALAVVGLVLRDLKWAA